MEEVNVLDLRFRLVHLRQEKAILSIVYALVLLYFRWTELTIERLDPRYESRCLAQGSLILI